MVTVKVAVAVASEFPSVAATVSDPAGAAAGTTNVQANAPSAVVVIVSATADPLLHALKEPMAIDSKLIVTAPPNVNPAPSAARVALTGPPMIVSVSVGEVIVIAATAVAPEF